MSRREKPGLMEGKSRSDPRDSPRGRCWKGGARQAAVAGGLLAAGDRGRPAPVGPGDREAPRLTGQGHSLLRVSLRLVTEMLTQGLQGLIEDGFPLTREDVAGLSPYITRKIKRFGDYVIDLSAPEPLDGALALAL